MVDQNYSRADFIWENKSSDEPTAKVVVQNITYSKSAKLIILESDLAKYRDYAADYPEQEDVVEYLTDSLGFKQITSNDVDNDSTTVKVEVKVPEKKENISVNTDTEEE